MKPDGGPAFPLQTTVASGEGGTITLDMPHMKMQTGMSLRDYFASAALAHPYTREESDPTNTNVAKAAEWAYRLADAMLAERDK